MIIKQEDKQKPPKNSTIQFLIIITILLIVTFTLEALLRNDLTLLSNRLLSTIQLNLNSTSHWLFSLSYYFTLLSHRYIYYAVIILVYNRENIFKPFCLLNLIFYCEMLCGFMKLLYCQDHPLNQSTTEIPLLHLFESDNQSSFAFPSKSLLIAPTFYFSVLRMYKFNKGEVIKERNIIGTIMICILIILISIGEFLLGYSSLNQILFSIALSVIIYFSMYYILQISYFNVSREFSMILRYPLKRIIIINVVALVLILLSYNLGPSVYMPNNNELKVKEAFCSFFIFFGNISLYLSMRFELNYNFEGHFSNWSQYNFDPNSEKHTVSNTLLNQISISKGVQWNRTVPSKYVGRLLILITVCIFCISISYIGNGKNEESSVWFVIIVRVMIPINLFCFTLGYGFKIVAIKFGLCNVNMFNMIRESI